MFYVVTTKEGKENINNRVRENHIFVGEEQSKRRFDKTIDYLYQRIHLSWTVLKNRGISTRSDDLHIKSAETSELTKLKKE